MSKDTEAVAMELAQAISTGLNTVAFAAAPKLYARLVTERPRHWVHARLAEQAATLRDALRRAPPSSTHDAAAVADLADRLALALAPVAADPGMELPPAAIAEARALLSAIMRVGADFDWDTYEGG